MEILKSLNHLNIVKFIDLIQDDKHMYIIFEYIENGSLKDILDKFGNFPESLAVRSYYHYYLYYYYYYYYHYYYYYYDYYYYYYYYYYLLLLFIIIFIESNNILYLFCACFNMKL